MAKIVTKFKITSDSYCSTLKTYFRCQHYRYTILTTDYMYCNLEFVSFSVMLVAILDLRHQDGHKMIKYLQNRLPLPQKHIYRYQYHYTTALRTEVMRKLYSDHLCLALGFSWIIWTIHYIFLPNLVKANIYG